MKMLVELIFRAGPQGQVLPIAALFISALVADDQAPSPTIVRELIPPSLGLVSVGVLCGLNININIVLNRFM